VFRAVLVRRGLSAARVVGGSTLPALPRELGRRVLMDSWSVAGLGVVTGVLAREVLGCLILVTMGCRFFCESFLVSRLPKPVAGGGIGVVEVLGRGTGVSAGGFVGTVVVTVLEGGGTGLVPGVGEVADLIVADASIDACLGTGIGVEDVTRGAGWPRCGRGTGVSTGGGGTDVGLGVIWGGGTGVSILVRFAWGFAGAELAGGLELGAEAGAEVEADVDVDTDADADDGADDGADAGAGVGAGAGAEAGAGAGAEVGAGADTDVEAEAGAEFSAFSMLISGGPASDIESRFRFLELDLDLLGIALV
jgi:hypothetical protein